MALSIFLNTTFWQLFEFFIWLLGAFLIGLYFGKLISLKKETKPINPHVIEDDLKLTDTKPIIRAIKTFERGGKQFVNTTPINAHDKGLNFDRIGIAEEKNKNNLKKIKGIGSSIELKLNNLGIFTYEQISNFNSADIKKITEILKFFPEELNAMIGLDRHFIL